jgi:cell division protein FtsN
VGSFRDENQARQLAAKLVRSGFPAYVSRAQIEGAGTRFRVRVGGYDNLDQAQNAATSLRVKENISAYVTRNE